MDDQSKHIKLYEGSMITLRALDNYLDDRKIACLIKDHSESQRLAGFGGNSSANELFVFEKDLEKAEKILIHFLED